MPTRHRLLLLLPLLSLAVVACQRPSADGDKRARDAKPADDAPILVGAEGVVRVARERIESGPALSGSLEARQRAIIRAEVGGSVSEVRVELGDPAKRGQTLARIEDQAQRDVVASAESAVTSAEQDAQLAQRQLERTTKLAGAGALAQRDLEVATSQAATAAARLDEAKARLAGARQQLDKATVRAPFDGVVSDRSVSVGDVVAPGTVLFSLIDPSTMRLTASVPSDAVAEISPGKLVSFVVKGYPGQRFAGSIERVAPAADEATRQIKVLVQIPNPGNKLIAGLFAEGRVAVDARETLVLPLGAVDVAGDKPRVLVVTGAAAAGAASASGTVRGRVEERSVTTGLRDDRAERIEITSGLDEGDLVLVGGARTIAPGSVVELTQPAAPTTAAPSAPTAPSAPAAAPVTAPATAAGG